VPNTDIVKAARTNSGVSAVVPSVSAVLLLLQDEAASMVQGFQTNYLNDKTCLNRQTNGQTNSQTSHQTSRQTNVKPVVKRAVKPAVKPVCLQATHTAQCHNELPNNDGFKIPPAKLNVHSPRTECTINATKKNRPKKKPEVCMPVKPKK
jgi:hypothetical protein